MVLKNKIQNLHQRLLKKRNQILEIQKQEHDLLEKLRSICDHSEVKPCSFYFNGSYLDTAYTEYWNECKICGLTSEKTTKNHGYL